VNHHDGVNCPHEPDSSLPQVRRLRCGATYRYDPNIAHACDALAGDEPTPPRGDDIANRSAAFEFEVRSGLNALERRIRELEAAPAGSHSKKLQAKASTSNDASAPARKGRNGNAPFDRANYHRAYMRAWRKRQTAAKRALRHD
jgi:hypothetical protein